MDELRDGKARACLDASAAARARGDLAGAISELNSAVFLRPTDASLYAARAELLLDACDFATALANLAKAVALTERRDLALILRLAHALDARGLTLLDEADYTGAVNAFGEALAAIDAAPEGGPPASGRQTAERAARERERARAVRDAVADADAGAGADADEAARRDAEVGAAKQAFRLHRALAYIGLGRTAAAVHDLHDLADAADASPDARFLLARLLLKSGALADARTHLSQALRADPAHAQAKALSEQMAASAKVYDEEATRLMLIGEVPKAISNLSSAIELEPTNALLYRRRALAHKQHDDARAAAADMEEAVRLAGGTFPEAERLLTGINNDAAIAEAAAGRLESALRYIDRAIERDATSARFRVNRADIARRLNDTEAALVDYAAARELCARTSSRRDDELAWEIECKVSLVHYEAGASHFNRTDYPAAFAAFSRALACNPRVPQYLLARAEVATMLKRWDVVRVDAEAALALAPDDAKARAMLSRVVPA